MRWVNIYEEYRNVIYDTLRVKHIYRKAGSARFYICQFCLEGEVLRVGYDLARKFYLVKSFSVFDKRPHRFNVKNGDVVRCYYERSTKHQPFILSKILLRRDKEVIYPHPCLKDRPVPLPMLTLFE